MLLIDTHTHLYLPEFDTDRDEMVSRAVSNGIRKLLMPNIDAGSVDSMLSAAERYKGVCFPMIGLHPASVNKDYLDQLENLEELIDSYEFVAVGEIGLDLYWDKTYFREQNEAMRIQVDLALRHDLPVVIHSREALPEVFVVLGGFRDSRLRGVFHAFSGTHNDAEKAAAMGFMLGIGGPLTFKNSKLHEIVKKTGIENLVLETDSPYLAPVPYRGKRNESSYLRIINSRLAGILGISEEESARITTENACRLFKI